MTSLYSPNVKVVTAHELAKKKIHGNTVNLIMQVKDKNTAHYFLRHNFDDFKLHYSLKIQPALRKCNTQKLRLTKQDKLGMMFDNIKYFSIERLSIKHLDTEFRSS